MRCVDRVAGATATKTVACRDPKEVSTPTRGRLRGVTRCYAVLRRRERRFTRAARGSYGESAGGSDLILEILPPARHFAGKFVFRFLTE